VGFRLGEYGCQIVGEFRARHHVGATGGAGFFGEIELDVRKKADQRKFRGGLAHAFDGVERIVTRVEIDDDEVGRLRGHFGVERVGRGAEVDVDADEFCGLADFCLEEDVVNESEGFGHEGIVSCLRSGMQRCGAMRYKGR
jgi:hypothetical protein